MKKKPSGISKHHRRPRSRGGSNHQSNISFVSKHKHRAYHVLFSNMNADEIAEELNNRWIDNDYIFLVRKRS